MTSQVKNKDKWQDKAVKSLKKGEQMKQEMSL